MKNLLLTIQAMLPYKIQEWIEIEQLLVVRIDSEDTIEYGDTCLDRNIYAFNKNAEMKWQILAIRVAVSPKPFTHMEYKNGELIVHNWVGGDYQVNLSNGQLKNIRPWSRLW
jgi:hypothetical protein